jgi:UDPglucose--hexose-1-phosphate uridylyltransferase
MSDRTKAGQRWNELRGEEVVYAIHRQERTFLPSRDHCPLCPTRQGERVGWPGERARGVGERVGGAEERAGVVGERVGGAEERAGGPEERGRGSEEHPGQPAVRAGAETEIPFPAFEIAVFENRFPAFAAPHGAAEVVVYTDDHDASFGTLAPERAEALMWVWRHRYAELGARADVEYVLIFENRGVEVGVTLHHPHGQLYGYPFLPPVPRLELAADARLGGCAPCALLGGELADGRRVVHENDGVVVFVPFAARWAYEAHVVLREHRPSLLDCEAAELRLLASGLQALVRGYDALFDRPFPYVMVVHQAPTVTASGSGAAALSPASLASDTAAASRPVAAGPRQGHLHVEFYPPLRTADKLKYLAGSEQGAGTFISDTLPESSAARLREAIARAA